jgi:uncharacterized C2H2 Zn-finger protein
MPYVEYDEVEAICPDCGRTFRSEDALASHLVESHAGRDDGPRGAAAPRSCPVCHEMAESDSALDAHVTRAHPTT